MIIIFKHMHEKDPPRDFSCVGKYRIGFLNKRIENGKNDKILSLSSWSGHF